MNDRENKDDVEEREIKRGGRGYRKVIIQASP